MSVEQDFSREQRLLNLAVKLQTGDATTDEVLQAANSLSFAAGERLRLEQRVVVLESALAYFMRVMKYFDVASELDDFLSWKVGIPGAPVQFFVVGGGCEEELTPDNLHILEQAFADIADLDDVSSYWALLLFLARAYGKEISAEMVQHVPAAALPLFAKAEGA